MGGKQEAVVVSTLLLVFCAANWCSSASLQVQTGWMPRQWGWVFVHRRALQVLRVFVGTL
jgi:hypothetical protein